MKCTLTNPHQGSFLFKASSNPREREHKEKAATIASSCIILRIHNFFWATASMFSVSRACQSTELWQTSLQNVFLIDILGHYSNTNCEVSHSHRQQCPELILSATEAAPHLPTSSRSINRPTMNTIQTQCKRHTDSFPKHWMYATRCDSQKLFLSVTPLSGQQFITQLKEQTVSSCNTPQRMLSQGTLPAPN